MKVVDNGSKLVVKLLDGNEFEYFFNNYSKQ